MSKTCTFTQDADAYAWSAHDVSLHILFDKLKANGSFVPTILGGGTFGYLELPVSVDQYAIFSQEPFIHPVNPGPFVTPEVGISAHPSMTLELELC